MKHLQGIPLIDYFSSRERSSPSRPQAAIIRQQVYVVEVRSHCCKDLDSTHMAVTRTTQGAGKSTRFHSLKKPLLGRARIGQMNHKDLRCARQGRPSPRTVRVSSALQLRSPFLQRRVMKAFRQSPKLVVTTKTAQVSQAQDPVVRHVRRGQEHDLVVSGSKVRRTPHRKMIALYGQSHPQC